MSLPDEMWGVVASFCPDGATWKVLRLISKAFYRVCEPINRDMVDRFCNPLLSLLEKFPKKNWDWECVSLNPNMTWGFVKDNPNLPWHWDSMACNERIVSPGMILLEDDELRTRLNETTTITWNAGYLCENSSMVRLLMSLEDSYWSKHAESYTRRYVFARMSLYVPLDVVRSNPEESWNWNNMSLNPNITWEFVSANMNKSWTWEFLAGNPGITCEVLFSEGAPWVKSCVSANPNVTLKMIEEHPEIEWDYEKLSFNPHLTLDFVKANLSKGWSWTLLSKRVSVSTALKNPELPWNEVGLSSSTSSKIRDVVTATWPGYMNVISRNIRLTYSEACEYSVLWNWRSLSGNSFRFEKYYYTDSHYYANGLYRYVELR